MANLTRPAPCSALVLALGLAPASCQQQQEAVMNTGFSRIVTGLALATALSTVGTVSARAGDRTPGIIGVWTVQVTLRNCATGDPLPGPPANGLVTFHGDNTLSEAGGSTAFAPGQRTTGHGVWARTGHRTFSQEFINLIAFDTPSNLPASPGFFAGWQTVTHEVELIDRDHLESSGTNAFFRLDGTQYRAGCSTAVGQRFE